MSTEEPKLRRNETAAPSREITREELAVSLDETRRAFELARAAWDTERARLKGEIANLKVASEGSKLASSKPSKENGAVDLQREVEKELSTQEAKLGNLEIILKKCDKALSEGNLSVRTGHDNLLEEVTSLKGEVQKLKLITENKPFLFARSEKKEAFKTAKARLEKIEDQKKEILERLREVNDAFVRVAYCPVGQKGYDAVRDVHKVNLEYFVNMGELGFAEFHSPQDRQTLIDLLSKLPADIKELSPSRRRVDALIKQVSLVKVHLDGLKGLFSEYENSKTEVFEKSNKIEAAVYKL